MKLLPGKQRIRTLLVAVAAVAVVGTLAACSSTAANAPTASASTTSQPAVTVRIGVVSHTAPPAMLALVGQDLGIAKKYGLDLTFVNISPDAAAQALASNQFDILAAPAIEQSILQGGKFKVIAGAAAPYFSLWGKKGDVTSWASLKGKSVGIPAGQDSTAAVLFTALLRQHKVDPTTVTMQYNTAVSNYQAMAAGAVDAGLTTPPYTYQLSSGGSFAQIDSLSKSQSGYLSTEFTAGDQYIQSNKATIKNFVEMLQASEKLIAGKPVSPKAIAAVNADLKASGTDPSQFDVKRFLTEMAANGTWQIIPTKKLITGDLSLLAQIPSLTASAKKATFSTMVYEVPELAKLYAK